jgi:hypothetical protein
VVPPLYDITITTDLPPIVVAVLWGPSGLWQPATQVSATRFTTSVPGPYVVAVQCADASNTSFATYEVAQTPADPHDLVFACATVTPDSGYAITGHMVQAGAVQLGDMADTSTTPSWMFSLSADAGTYDLLATTTNAIAIRRGIAVSGDLAITPQVDLGQEGTPLVATAFSVTNPMSGETVTAHVNLDNASLFDANVYTGPLAGGKVAPDAVLVAGDRQSASMQAMTGTRGRALRRPFHAGDSAAYTLPPPSDVQLAVSGGQLDASWTTLLPDFTLFDVYAASSTNTTYSYLDLEVTPSFLADTGFTRLVIDTQIPGYDAAHGVDFTGMYQRGMMNQSVDASHVVTTTWFDETPNGFMARARAHMAGAAPGTWNRGIAGAARGRPRTHP